MKGVLAAGVPSALLTRFAWPAGKVNENDASSLTMVPDNDLAITSPSLEFDSITSNPSFSSTIVSPATLTVIVFLVSPAANSSVPDGKIPPTKSWPVAGLVPEPATAHATLADPVATPERVTVNVKAV